MDSSSDSESDLECGFLVFFLKKGEQTYTLSEGETTVGSSIQADIRFNNVSQLDPIYCSIDVNENGIATLFNKSTADPTKVNGVEIKNYTVLRSGDFLEVRGKKFQYHNDFVTNMEIDAFIKDQFARSRRKSTAISKSAKKSPTSSKKSSTLKRISSGLTVRKQIRKSESFIHSIRPNSEKKSKRHTAISFNTRKSSVPIGKSENKPLARNSSLKLSSARKSRASTGKSSPALEDINESFLLENSMSDHSVPESINESSLLKDSLLKDDNKKKSIANRHSNKYLLVDLGKSSLEDKETNDARKSKQMVEDLRELFAEAEEILTLKPNNSKSRTSTRRSVVINLCELSYKEADEIAAVSSKTARLTKSPTSPRKSRTTASPNIAVITDYNIAAVNDTDSIVSSSARQSRSTTSRRCTTSRRSTTDSKRSIMSTTEDPTLFATPDSAWSTKTNRTTTPFLRDSEIDHFGSRPSSTQKNFKTSTVRKSTRSKSLSVTTPIADHNYCKRGSKSLSEANIGNFVANESGIDVLEAAFPTKRLPNQRPKPSGSLFRTPDQNKVLSRSDRWKDLPSPVLLENSLASRLRTPDRCGRWASKLSVRWSKSLVSIRTPESTEKSSGALKSALKDNADVEATDHLSKSASETPNHNRTSSKSCRDDSILMPPSKIGNSASKLSTTAALNQSGTSRSTDIGDVLYTSLTYTPPVETHNQSKMSFRSRKSVVQYESDIIDLEKQSPTKRADRGSKSITSTIGTPNQFRISDDLLDGSLIPGIPAQSTRSRKSTVQDEFADIPSPIQMNLRIANSLLSKSQTPETARSPSKPRKSTTNSDLDLPSPIPTEQPATKYLISNLQTPDHPRRSSRSRRSALTGDFEYAYSATRKTLEKAADTYALSDTWPVVAGSEDGSFEDETHVKDRSKTDETSNSFSVITLNDSSEDTDDVFTVTSKSDRRSSRNMTYNNDSESATIIILNDTEADHEDLEPIRRSERRTKSTPYTPITKDIIHASTRKVIEAQNSPKNDLTNVDGVKKLFQMHKEVKSPQNDFTEVPNLKRIMSPRQQNDSRNSDLDLPSPIPTEQPATKYFVSKLRTPDHPRRSSRSRRSTLTGDFEYAYSATGKSLDKAANTYVLSETRPVGAGSEEGSFEDETHVVKDKSKTDGTSNSFPVITLTDSSKDTDEVFNVTSKSDRSSRNRTYNKDSESATIMILNDTEADHVLETIRRSERRTQSTPYIPITEDITPASTRKALEAQNSPKNDLTNVQGVKKLFATPKEVKSPRNDLSEVPNLRRIMSPRQQKAPRNSLSDFKGVKKLMKTPRTVRQPLNDLRFVRGLKRLMATPKATQKEPVNRLSDFEGVAHMFNASTNSDIENEELFSKVFDRQPLKTYRSKSLSMSPSKRIDDGSTRKSILDDPFVSPRVDDWIEEQATLKQKAMQKGTTEATTPKPLLEAVAIEEATPTKLKRKAKEATESGEESALKKTKATTRDVTEEIVKLTKDETSVSHKKNVPEQMKIVKKKVTYMEETTYFQLNPVEIPTRSHKEKIEDKKPARATRGKKEQTEVDLQTQISESSKKPATKSARGKKTKQNDEEGELPPSRSRRGKNAAKQPEEAATRSHEEKIEDKKPARSTRGKKDQKEVDLQTQIAESPKKSATKYARGKKTVQTDEESELPPSKSRRGKNAAKQPEDAATRHEEKIEDKKPAGSTRGKKDQTEVDLQTQIAECPKKPATKSARGKKTVQKDEESELPPSRSRRGKNTVKQAEDAVDDVEEKKPTSITRKDQKQEPSENADQKKPQRGKKEATEEDEAPKAPSGRSRRGKLEGKPKDQPKQSERPKKTSSAVDEEEKAFEKLEIEEVKEGAAEEKVYKSRRGNKKEEVSEKTKPRGGHKVEEEKMDEMVKAPSRPRRVANKDVALATNEDLNKVVPQRSRRGEKKVTEDAEQAIEQVTMEEAPSRARRGRKAAMTEVQEPFVEEQPKKAVKKVAKDVSMDAEETVTSRPKRGKKGAISEDVEGAEKPFNGAKRVKRDKVVTEAKVSVKQGRQEEVDIKKKMIEDELEVAVDTPSRPRRRCRK